MDYLRRKLWILAIPTLLLGCGEDDPTVMGGDELTAPDAVERQLTIQSHVYVDVNASSSTIKYAVERQVRTAFGPLRIAKISVDDRELKSNVDPSNFQAKELDLVKKDADGTLQVEKKVKQVSYTYRARALVHKSKASKTSFSLALLMGNYQSFVSDIIKDCVENYEHDQEFASSFWYVWAPAQYACKQRIEDEVQQIQTERQDLSEGQIGATEHGRRFLPLNVQLEAVEGPKTTYPEYDRLYGLGDPAKTTVVVYQIMGVASHAGDPDSQRFENDMGFKEFLKEVKVLSDRWPKLHVSSDSSVDPLQIPYDGKTYAASFSDLYKWGVSLTSFPAGVDSQKFRRAIHDQVVSKWIRLDVPLTVQAGHTTKQMTLQFRMLFGTESGWSVRSYFKEAFTNGDVVLYNGHSYIGSGPLDPNNYSASDFGAGYQILFFNSCVSFNYYGVDYFDLKQGGSANVDLVNNGIEVWILDGGKSMGQFLIALFDGKQNSWMQVLKKTQVTPFYSVHDPNRAVDGEQDNVYDPSSAPISVKEGWDNPNPLTVQLTSAACGSTVSGAVELSAVAPGATRVSFFVDTTQVGGDTTEPFSLSWDSSAVADGSVTLKAVAMDASGQSAEITCHTTVHNGGGQTDLFFDDMEGAASGWTATGLWHRAQSGSCATPAYASAVSAWYFGQESTCNYDSGATAKGTLTSPTVNAVTSTSRLAFKYWREVESTSSGTYDKTVVQVSGDGGGTWKSLWSKDSGDASAKAWSSVDLSLSELAGKNIQIRFSFDSVDSYSNDHVGWLIDDVRVTQ